MSLAGRALLGNPLTLGKLFVASGPQFNWKQVLSKSDVDMVNVVIIQFAHQNVYASAASEEMRLLVDRNINRIRFGDNALLPAAPHSGGESESSMSGDPRTPGRACPAPAKCTRPLPWLNGADQVRMAASLSDRRMSVAPRGRYVVISAAVVWGRTQPADGE